MPNVVAECRYGKTESPTRKAWQMRRANEHRWVDHGYLMKTASAALKAVSQSPRLSKFGGPGAIRTRDTRFRRAVLYPLSYGAIWSRVPVGS